MRALKQPKDKNSTHIQSSLQQEIDKRSLDGNIRHSSISDPKPQPEQWTRWWVWGRYICKINK